MKYNLKTFIYVSPTGHSQRPVNVIGKGLGIGIDSTSTRTEEGAISLAKILYHTTNTFSFQIISFNSSCNIIGVEN